MLRRWKSPRGRQWRWRVVRGATGTGWVARGTGKIVEGVLTAEKAEPRLRTGNRTDGGDQLRQKAASKDAVIQEGIIFSLGVSFSASCDTRRYEAAQSAITDGVCVLIHCLPPALSLARKRFAGVEGPELRFRTLRPFFVVFAA